MQIYGPSQVHGPHALQDPHFTNRAHGSQAGSAASGPTDQLDISPAAEAAAQASEAGQVRSDLVARVRSEIASGTYETPDKLDAALDRLLDHLG